MSVNISRLSFVACLFLPVILHYFHSLCSAPLKLRTCKSIFIIPSPLSLDPVEFTELVSARSPDAIRIGTFRKQNSLCLALWGSRSKLTYILLAILQCMTFHSLFYLLSCVSSRYLSRLSFFSINFYVSFFLISSPLLTLFLLPFVLLLHYTEHVCHHH